MKGVSFGGFTIDDAAAPVFIAEAGVNHDGNVEKAHLLIDAAAASGAHCVKFQTFEASELASPSALAASYQVRTTGQLSQYKLLESLSLPRGVWVDLAMHAKDAGLVFLSTPFDLASAELLISIGVPALKVPSGELTNLSLIRALSRMGVPLLLSTGMGSMADVAAALSAAVDAPGVALFHCVSAYPAPPNDCCLRAIPTMQEWFDVPVGWSDHTLGAVAAIVAGALGARLFEKHFTIRTTDPGPDHAASLDPTALANYIKEVNTAVLMLGNGVKQCQPSEVENATAVRRSWFARRDLPANSIIRQEDIVALRPETGISVSVDITGRVISRPVAAGEVITDRVIQL